MISTSETGRHMALITSRNELFTMLYRDYDKRIADAMTVVPREEFVGSSLYARSFEDSAQPIKGYELFSSISQPTTIAHMTQLLNPQEEDVVLEIGTATGYQAAVLGQLCQRVYSVESIPELAHSAGENLRRLKYNNVHVIVADGSRRFTPPEQVDKLLITASVFPAKDLDIFSALKTQGICVCPIGGVGGIYNECSLVRMIKTDDGMALDVVLPIRYFFVPLEGVHGWTSHILHFIDLANKHFYKQHGYTRETSAEE